MCACNALHLRRDAPTALARAIQCGGMAPHVKSIPVNKHSSLRIELAPQRRFADTQRFARSVAVPAKFIQRCSNLVGLQRPTQLPQGQALIASRYRRAYLRGR